MFQPRRIGRSHENTPNTPRAKLDRSTLRVFGRLLQFVRPYRLWMILAALALLISTLLNLVLPLVIRNLVDVVFADSDLTFLNRLAYFLFAIFALQAVFSFVHRYTLAFVGERAIADLRVAIYRHLQSLSFDFFADRRTGEIVSRLTSDVTQVQSAVTDNVIELLKQIVTLIGASALLFYLNWQLTLLILVGIPLISLTIVMLGKRIRQASKAVQDRLADSANVVEETVSGIRIVKSFAREEYEVGRYQQTVLALYQAAMQRTKISATLAPLIGFMAFSSIIFTLWFGSRQVLMGNLTEGGLVAYLVYTMMVASPVSILANLVSQFQAAMGAGERVFELLDTPPTVADAPTARPIPPLKGEVIFRQVHFRYQDRQHVLAGIDFTAQAGQLIALVGPSGAGKSTLVNLIPRFYDVREGAVLLDGYDVREVTQRSLREQIGLVPQESLLFSDTVANNIRYGKLDATSAELIAAARSANAHDFILHDLPDGYETVVGERGIKLSGGQRQRIAIARALLKDPRILILDEATSSLDNESERLVQEALERLMIGRTTFVIAHRLSTIHNADWILVMDQGQIVEQGTHEALIGREGLYAKLYHLQFREPAPPNAWNNHQKR